MDNKKIEAINWTAPEYLHKKHSNDWFWGWGLLTLVGILATLWFRNYVLTIFVLISGVLLIIFSAKHPKLFNFSIRQKGFLIDKEEFGWRSLKKFNIKEIEGGLYNKLLLETDGNFLPLLTFLVPKEITTKVEKELKKVITKEADLEEPKTILLAEKIGF